MPVLAPARIVDGHVVVECEACARGPVEESIVAAAGAARVPHRRPALLVAVGVGIGAGLFLIGGQHGEAQAVPPPAMTVGALTIAPLSTELSPELVDSPAAVAATADLDPDRGMGNDDVRGTDPAESANVVPSKLDEPLDVWYPSLRDWTHPVVGSTERVPTRSTRWFGADRSHERSECGRGHCGVDLAGARGKPVVAVAAGIVVHVEHRSRGRDGRSGRYVRIEHPDGVFTSYMHLDAIARELAVGDEVAAGQLVGTLGVSGIHHSDPHLHFALEIPKGRGGDELTFIDPSPFLRRANLLRAPDRRPARANGDGLNFRNFLVRRWDEKVAKV